MTLKNWQVCFFLAVILSCQTETGGGGENKEEKIPASVTFINYTSFNVDIYRNFNPAYFDPTTLACSVERGKIKTITLYESADQVTGDTFYIHYKVFLDNKFETGGTADNYADAQRDVFNISFVVESGEEYQKTIPQPDPKQLKLVNGIIAIHNMESSQIQVLRGDANLLKLDDRGLYLKPWELGYYEIPMPSFEDTITISQLKVIYNTWITIPTFTMERNKLYKFEVKNGTVNGPVVSTISILR